VRPPAPPDGPADAGETDGARSAEALLVLEHVRAAERPLTLTELVEAIGDTPPARVRRRVRELIDEERRRLVALRCVDAAPTLVRI